jgi:hypothetical protein
MRKGEQIVGTVVPIGAEHAGMLLYVPYTTVPFAEA